MIQPKPPLRPPPVPFFAPLLFTRLREVSLDGESMLHGEAPDSAAAIEPMAGAAGGPAPAAASRLPTAAPASLLIAQLHELVRELHAPE